MDKEIFKNPTKEYRPSVFWSWNDRLTEGELRRQVRELKKQGYGGFFMHSRVGLKNEYLSEDWMNCIKVSYEEAVANDMEAWLYDEDKFPSGCAGGLVTAISEEYRAKYLKMLEISESDIKDKLNDPRVLGVFEIHFKDGKAESFIRIGAVQNDICFDRCKDVEKNETVRYCAFRIMTNSPSNWFNGQSYVDVMSPEAIWKFIEITHEKYTERFGKNYGEYMPGIFTDEPACSTGDGDSVPWTLGLEIFFEEQTGYSLIEKLPLLFFDISGFTKVRYDFYRTVTQRFVSAFTKQIYDYCRENNLKFTGHYLWEDNLFSQVQFNGAVMPHYEYMDVPGVDLLCVNPNGWMMLRQCTSVAHQLGRNRVICEAFGVTGQGVDTESVKLIGDSNFVHGVTFLCQHLTAYSIVGERKRDFPPTFSYHQPYWDEYRAMNDYFARASWVCSQGDYLADTLLLHPISSAWCLYPSKANAAEKASADRIYDYSEQLNTLMRRLLERHIGFDLGDETIMQKYSGIELDEGQAVLKVGLKGRYKVVLVPPSLNWSSSTYKLLKEFAQKGGKVIFIGETPALLDGVEAAGQWNELLSVPGVLSVPGIKSNGSEEDVCSLLGSLLTDEIKISPLKGDASAIFIHGRIDGKSRYYFLCSKDRNNTVEAEISFPVRGRVEELDLMTGEIRELPVRSIDGRTVIYASFPPIGSKAYRVDMSEAKENAAGAQARVQEEVPVARDSETAGTDEMAEACKTRARADKNGAAGNHDAGEKTGELVLSDEWKFKRTHPNSITLDYCRYSLNEGGWSELLPVWKVRKKLWMESGLGEYEGVQPWVLERDGIDVEKPLRLRMKYTFSCAQPAVSCNISLVVEQIGKWDIWVNGQEVRPKEGCWHWDKQFGLADISGVVREGLNEVVISCSYRQGVEVEDIYLIGDFGVRQTGYRSFELCEEPSALHGGSWVYQNYPFYSGNMIYRQGFDITREEGSRYILKLDRPMGTMFKVLVNGKEARTLICQPWEADITSLLADGSNEVKIVVYGSLRNTLGPFHKNQYPDPGWIAPEDFCDDKRWTDRYQFKDYGIGKGVRLDIYRR